MGPRKTPIYLAGYDMHPIRTQRGSGDSADDETSEGVRRTSLPAPVTRCLFRATPNMAPCTFLRGAGLLFQCTSFSRWSLRRGVHRSFATRRVPATVLHTVRYIL